MKSNFEAFFITPSKSKSADSSVLIFSIVFCVFLAVLFPQQLAFSLFTMFLKDFSLIEIVSRNI